MSAQLTVGDPTQVFVLQERSGEVEDSTCMMTRQRHYNERAIHAPSNYACRYRDICAHGSCYTIACAAHTQSASISHRKEPLISYHGPDIFQGLSDRIVPYILHETIQWRVQALCLMQITTTLLLHLSTITISNLAYDN